MQAIADDRDRRACEQLSSIYAGKLAAFVRARKVPDPESVTQDVLLAIWRHAARYDPSRAAVQTWIFTIARNRVIDCIRKAHRPAPDPRDPSYVQTQTQTTLAPDAHAERNQRLEQLKSALGQLSDQQREIMQRVYIEGESIARAAQQLNIPTGTAKSRIRLALQSLRTTMKSKSGGEHGPTSPQR